MDAGHALADLLEISAEVRRAVLVDADGRLIGAEPPGEDAAARLAEAAATALAEAEALRPGSRATQLEAATPGGRLFVVREHGRTVAATTGPACLGPLVLHDLRACLRASTAAVAA